MASFPPSLCRTRILYISSRRIHGVPGCGLLCECDDRRRYSFLYLHQFNSLLGEVKAIEEEERILFEEGEYGIAHPASQLHSYDMFVFRPLFE